MEKKKKKIKHLLNEKSWSIGVLSSKIGYSRQNTYNIVNGDQKISLELLTALSKAFGVKMEYWFKEENEPNMVQEPSDPNWDPYKVAYINALQKIIDMKDDEIKRLKDEIKILKNTQK